MNNNDFNLISIFLSMSALLVSTWNIWMSRKRIKVYFENTVYFGVKHLFTSESDCIAKTPSCSYDNLYTCFIKVVNPCSTDMAFFDLEVFDNDNNKYLSYLVKANIGLNFNDRNDVYYWDKKRDGFGRIYILNSDFGIFNANSFTKIEIPVMINNPTSNITLRFKVAKHSILPNLRYKNRKFYKSYSKQLSVIYNADDWH